MNDESTFELFMNWWAHYIKLPDNKVSNVIIVAEDQSSYNKLTTPGARQKLKERLAIVEFGPPTVATSQPTFPSTGGYQTKPDAHIPGERSQHCMLQRQNGLDL